MSNMGLWDRWYAMLGTEPEPYGDSETYQLGTEWLEDCALVEDWGCGKGWLRRFIPPERYRGIDGSTSPFADDVVDLVTYKSSVPGIFMRHVLEHNFDWEKLLANALESFQQRMVLILFTPLGQETHDMEWEPDPGVPNLSFKLLDLTSLMDMAMVSWSMNTLASPTKYGVETIFRIER